MDHLSIAVKEWREAAEKMHAATCQAVALLNRAPEVVRCAEGREARDVLRQALADYADNYCITHPICDDAADEIERLQKVWEDTRTQRDELLAHIAGKAPLPQWAADWLKA